VIVLFLVVFVGLLGFGIILPLFPFYAQRFGASPEVITWTMSVFTLGQMVATPVWGRLGDAWGRRPVLVVTLAGTTLSYVMLAFADTLELVILSRVFAGLMAGNISAAFAYVADITTPETRAGGMGRIGAALGLGFMLGPALGGLLAGGDVETANYTRTALGAASLSFAAMLGAIFLAESLAPEHRRPVRLRRDLHPRSVGGAASRLLTRAGFLPLVGAALVFYMSMSIMESIFSLWANDRFDYGPRSIGVVFFVMGGIQAVVQGAVVGRLSKRFGERRVATAAAAIVAVGLALLSVASAQWQLWVGVVVFSVAVGAINPALSSLVSRTAAPHEYGSVMGWYQSASAVGRVLGPGLSGVLYSQFGQGAPFAVASAIMLPVLALVGLLRPLPAPVESPPAGPGAGAGQIRTEKEP
jgi:DHA1 family tetracycline resistance protein-like MFS transporter